jgi:cell wall assembly regulator SMI1
MNGVEALSKAKMLFAEMDQLFQAQTNPTVKWFKAGLDEGEIAAHEARLGISLPIEHKAALQVFDGFEEERISMGHVGETFTGFYLSPLASWRCEEEQNLIKDIVDAARLYGNLKPTVVGPAKSIIYHPDWIPITMPSAWYSWYVDFAPEVGGDVGQIVFVKCDEATLHVEVVAKNFLNFMEIMIQSIKSNDDSDW